MEQSTDRAPKPARTRLPPASQGTPLSAAARAAKYIAAHRVRWRRSAWPTVLPVWNRSRHRHPQPQAAKRRDPRDQDRDHAGDFHCPNHVHEPTGIAPVGEGLHHHLVAGELRRPGHRKGQSQHGEGMGGTVERDDFAAPASSFPGSSGATKRVCHGRPSRGGCMCEMSGWPIPLSRAGKAFISWRSASSAIPWQSQNPNPPTSVLRLISKE